MSRVFTLKHVGIAFAVVVAAAVSCLMAGNTDMASALFVVAIVEGAFGVSFVAIKRI